MIRLDRFVLLVGYAALTLTLSACSPQVVRPEQPEQLSGWQTVSLPAEMVPSSLLLSHGSLLVGGSRPSGGGRAPALVSLPLSGSDTAPRPLRLTPTTPYGKVADLVFLTGTPDRDRLVAIGAAHGGAHANSRWTAWMGPTDRMVDRPQTFETFGGWDAGTLLGLATDARGPLVVGTWQGEYGADGAVWRADGQRWVRQPVPTALANGPQRQVAPQGVDQQSDGSVVLDGAVIDLTDGVHQAAAYWRDVDGSWMLTELAEPGRRSVAWSTACSASCWTVGARDGSLAIWAGDALPPVAPLAAADTDRGRVLLWRDRVVVPVSSNGAGRLLIGHGDSWRTYTAPAGRVLAAQLVGTRLYLITRVGESGALHVRDLADLLAG